MVALVAALALVQQPFWVTQPWPGPAPKASEAPIEVKVLVLNFDPIIESEGGKRVWQVMGWDDPRALAAGYAADVEKASGGYVRHRIVEWRDLDEYPAKTDGFVYDDATWLSVLRSQSKAHDPDGTDYPAMIERYGVVEKIDSGEIDELWIFGGPYYGFWESCMAGPGAFFINGGVYDQVPSKKPFAIMGFNPEREVDEMLHNLSHRTENHLKRAYGRWEPGEPTNLWERFSAFEKTSPTFAACGNCHFPPNGEKDYDYDNPRTVMSEAEDWLNFPSLTGQQEPVSRETWGGPDYHLGYMRWWFTRLPKAPGTQPDGRQNNWWKYIYRFRDYDESGLPR